MDQKVPEIRVIHLKTLRIIRIFIMTLQIVNFTAGYGYLFTPLLFDFFGQDKFSYKLFMKAELVDIPRISNLIKINLLFMAYI